MRGFTRAVPRVTGQRQQTRVPQAKAISRNIDAMVGY